MGFVSVFNFYSIFNLFIRFIFSIYIVKSKLVIEIIVGKKYMCIKFVWYKYN